MSTPIKQTHITEESKITEQKTTGSIPFLVYFGEDYHEDESQSAQIYMSKTANPEATYTGNRRDDTNG